MKVGIAWATTLDVLVIGLVAITLFEIVLSGLRTYVFSHTTSRVDVELGARLFRHLLALPIAYFESRQVGQTVARVRELENIRSFLTGSALTVVLDLLFVFVFLGVMYHFSPTLTWIVLGAIPFYAALSLAVTPVLRRRIEERFQRGAAVQSFLVEAVSGIETLKAAAVEPQMRQRWDEQLAAYVRSSFRTIVLATKLAGAHEFILGLPHGYDTVLGERGSNLSGGQRQRIAIARALVTEPRILIFDEATSALDYESERIIQDNMREICKGRTVIVIAHRLSTVRGADRIVTIEAGTLVEEGTHAQLIAKGGRYADLHKLQSGSS